MYWVYGRVVGYLALSGPTGTQEVGQYIVYLLFFVIIQLSPVLPHLWHVHGGMIMGNVQLGKHSNLLLYV